MKLVVACTKHNALVEGPLRLAREDEYTDPLFDDLPDNIVNKTTILAYSHKMWVPDTSEMHCAEAEELPNVEGCQGSWEVHIFGPEGAWLTYGGPEDDKPLN